MITDMLRFAIKEGYVPEAITLMKTQTQETLNDDGCLVSKAFQSRANPNCIYMLLCWEDQAAIDKHLASEHDLKFREGLDPLLASPPEFFEWDEIV